MGLDGSLGFHSGLGIFSVDDRFGFYSGLGINGGLGFDRCLGVYCGLGIYGRLGFHRSLGFYCGLGFQRAEWRSGHGRPMSSPRLKGAGENADSTLE